MQIGLRFISYIIFCLAILWLVSIVPKLTIGLIFSFNYYLEVTKLSWVIMNNPNSAKAFNDRGTWRAEYGDRQGAISDFTQVIKIESNNPKSINGSPYVDRAQEYEITSDLKKAIADYQKAAKLYKQEGEIFNYKMAIDDIKNLKKKAPTN
jgi:tetratricopeptide (TPR) repeat protein